MELTRENLVNVSLNNGNPELFSLAGQTVERQFGGVYSIAEIESVLVDMRAVQAAVDKGDIVFDVKACPFCGQEVAVFKINDVSRVECSNPKCAVIGPVAANDAEAVATWNKRIDSTKEIVNVEVTSP